MSLPAIGQIQCHHCFSTDVVRFGAKKNQRFVDLPWKTKATYIFIDRKRYRCKVCGKTFLEKLHGIDEKRNISLRLLDYIEQNALHRSLLSIANDVALNEGTIRNIFKDYLARLEGSFAPATPKVLSFDEVTVTNKPRYLVGNFEQQTIIGLLPGKDYNSVAAYLEQLPDKENVQAVVMDMNPACRDAMRTFLPDAKIVVNPESVDNTLLRIVEKVRQATRKGLPDKDLRLLVHDKELIGKHIEELSDEDKNRLEIWEKRFRKLVFAYWRKEELRIILKEGNKDEAMEQYLIWQKNVLADSIKEYFPVIDYILDWQKEVFGWMELNVRNKNSYFENISTLEGVLVNSLDLGYTFQAVKAQILRQQSAGSKKGIKFSKVIWKMVPGQQN